MIPGTQYDLSYTYPFAFMHKIVLLNFRLSKVQFSTISFYTPNIA
jgi:hypothetical protein